MTTGKYRKRKGELIDHDDPEPKRGRPSSFSWEVADEICARIAEGEPLRAICRDEDMPAWRTVYDWLTKNEEFSARFARARDIGHDAIAEQALEIADTPMIGQRREQSDDGFKVVEEDMLGHRKLQVETRLKLLAKWNPKKYGERVDLNHGGQADNPLTMLLRQVQGTQLKPTADPDE